MWVCFVISAQRVSVSLDEIPEPLRSDDSNHCGAAATSLVKCVLTAECKVAREQGSTELMWPRGGYTSMSSTF